MLNHHHRHHFVSRVPNRVRHSHQGDDDDPMIRPIYVGISANILKNGVDIGFALNDGNYTMDYAVLPIKTVDSQPLDPTDLADFLIDKLKISSHEHCFKFVAIGVSHHLARMSPLLCTRLWKDLDAVPVVLDVRITGRKKSRGEWPQITDDLTNHGPLSVTRPVDEQADSTVRKLLTLFSEHCIRISIGKHNQVDVDHDGVIHLIDAINEYRGTTRKPTWNALIKYSAKIRQRGLKAAFFSSTPQGGGVALMRHALVRLFDFLGVDVKWYVPKPSPNVFRITKDNHNILQGIADPALRLTSDAAQKITNWIEYNAEQYWLCEGGPLAPGGIDIAIIDDPQMPGLIPLIKKARPEIPIIYRSHIEIRSDLIAKPGSPQAEVWDYLYERIRHADIFISHPIHNFIPLSLPAEIVGLLPATTDWLDGLNKPMREWDRQYYMGKFRAQCIDSYVAPLDYPKREYIIQIARFDPAKGLDVAVDSYVKLRRKLEDEKVQWTENSKGSPPPLPPQLVLCGHGAVDDPDGSIVHDALMETLSKETYRPYASDIIIMRIGPSDQMLNALLTNSKFALQLSSREGFEVKVSEALHKGKPVIATRAGGIPLQVQDGKNGYVCDIGDTDAIFTRMHELWVNKDGVYTRMSEYAKRSVSDEVGTVGNAVSWLFLVHKMTKMGDDGEREKVKPNGRWINDMAREEVGELYDESEPKLPRIMKE